MMGINSIEFNNTNGKILSADAKSMRVYDRNTGDLFTSVEPGYNINKIVPFKDSGLIFMPCEAKRIGAFFIPSLGPAPKFCSFLDNLTEEMEESNTSSVYDEYKFLTMEELEKYNGKHLVGTKFLKSYMHGYILKSKMFDKVRENYNFYPKTNQNFIRKFFFGFFINFFRFLRIFITKKFQTYQKKFKNQKNCIILSKKRLKNAIKN